MIEINIKNNILYIKDSSLDIFEWEHKLFFTVVVGYQADLKNRQYKFTNRKKITETIKETIDYFEEKDLKYDVDSEVKNIIEKMRNDQKEFENAFTKGIEILKKQISDVDIHNFIRALKPYQEKGVEHLLEVKHGANFSVPGSGKTSVIYALYNVLKNKKIIDLLLVIGPRSCFMPWEEEAENCFGKKIKNARLTGTKISRRSIYLQAFKFDLLLCNYQTATNDINEIIELSKKYKVLMVIDESHNIKRFEDGVWSEAIIDIGQYATRRAILTGTPMPNSYIDLWTQFTFLWPGGQVLGDKVSFRYQCDNEHNFTKIKESIKPFYFRVTKNDLKLPPMNFIVKKYDMNLYQKRIYHSLAVEFLQELEIQPEEKMILRQWRKAKMIRLMQAASNPTLLRLYSEEFNIPPISSKVSSLIELIDKYPKFEIPGKFEYAIKLIYKLLSDGKKVILWTSFIHNIKMLKKLLKDTNPFIVYGAVPKDETEDLEFNREQQINNFKSSKKPTILIANPAACAESISLHKVCHDAIYLDRNFNCGQYMQSLDRIHRIGLTKDEIVNYYLLISKDSIDETINRRLKEKQNNMLKLLEDELPIGTFEVEDYQMEFNEDEEERDFEETIKDLKKVFGN